jgi:two-component system, NtrC family, response regulator HydG
MNKIKLLNNLPVGIFVADSQFRIHFVNNEMVEMSGKSRSIITRRGISAFGLTRANGELMKPEDNDCICKKGERVIQRHLYLSGKNRKLIPVFISGVRVEMPSIDDPIIFTVTDLTRIEGCGILPANERKETVFHNIIGQSSSMINLFKHIELAANSDVTVMVLGESGTGKELIASAIHNESFRRKGPFIKVNCSSLVETLLESELFGHAKGSFTGAISDRAGKFEAADGGTLFLDEIGDVSPSIQVKLLRAVQEKIVTRVGENQDRSVDIRLITATNRDIRKMVVDGAFREDLFFRLNVFPITTTPLRERGKDILLIARHIIEKFNTRYGKFIQGFERSVAEAFLNYQWAGNIRELENAIEYAFVLRDEGEITLDDLPKEISDSKKIKREEIAVKTKSKYSRVHIDKNELADLLEKNGYSRKAVAEYLGISTVALWKKMKKFNMI